MKDRAAGSCWAFASRTIYICCWRSKCSLSDCGRVLPGKMTEFWVSQGNKWCDFCKIFISNNSTSIRTHELGTRHKDNVTKKLAGIRKDNAVKEREKLLALKDLEKIETQAKKSYERDLAAMRGLDSTSKGRLSDTKNKGSVTRAPEESLEAVPAAQRGSGREPVGKKIVKNALNGQPSATRNASSAYQNGRSSKGMMASSLEVSKRKRVEKPVSNSSEEAAALAARESARKRIKEREESLMGLYHSF